MTVALVAQAAGSSNGSNGQTCGPIDTRTATLIVLAESYYSPNGAPTPGDSESMTWANLTPRTGPSVAGVRLCFVNNPTTSAAHSFSTSGSNSFSGMVVAAFSGVTLGTTSDIDVGQGGTSPTVQTGSATPAARGELVLTACAFDGITTGVLAVDSGFSLLTSQDDNDGGANVGCALAWQVQAIKAALNPTWTLGGGPSNSAAVMAAFAAPVTPRGSFNFLMGKL